MNRKETIKRLAEQVRLLWFLMGFSILCHLVSQVCGIAILSVGAWWIGQVLLADDPQRLDYLFVLLGIVGLLKGIFHYLSQYTSYSVTLRLLKHLRIQLYERLEPLAPAGLMETRTGDIVSRAITDIDRLEVFYARTIVPGTVAVLVMLISVYAMGAWFSIWLALLFLPFLLIVGGALPWWLDRESKQVTTGVRLMHAELSAHVTDGIQGLREIVAFGREEQRRQDIRTRGENTAQVQGHLSDITGRHDMLTDLVIGLNLLAVLGVGLWLADMGILPVVELPAALALVVATYAPVLAVTGIIPEVNEALASANRLFELMDRAPLVRETATEPPPEPVTPSIEFSGVYFHYPTPTADEVPWVHQDLSFSIAAGQTVAVVGASGVGKTSLVNELLRFWEIDKGEIRIGGIDLRDFPLDDLRRRIAVVAQNTYIFGATIKANLLLGKPNAAQEEIEAATRRANLHDFIMSLPDKYETRVGEMGVGLSGGQRQRLAIARALLKNAPILLLDEATSNLDTVNEREIQAAIQEQLVGGRTTIIIAHRLSTVVNADKILVMDNGTVVEQGTHAELLARNGIYARLAASQRDDLDEIPAVLETTGDLTAVLSELTPEPVPEPVPELAPEPAPEPAPETEATPDVQPDTPDTPLDTAPEPQSVSAEEEERKDHAETRDFSSAETQTASERTDEDQSTQGQRDEGRNDAERDRAE